MKSGLFVLVPIEGAAGERIASIQREFDPRLAAQGMPHLTLIGSSGMGPIDAATPREAVAEVLARAAAETAPMRLPLGHPIRFMQSDVVVLLLDPHGPLRALHERIKRAGFAAAPPRFAFTPHVTLSFYREQPRDRLRQLLAHRVTEPAEIRHLRLYHTWEHNVKTELLGEWELSG
ncbi:MAG TPA: 2'-5' RNA ligase family protein [Gemmatimonadaceae bacterium]|nr:2'-5' RNA ligase family protein [Gemmatimonadaceae bacterium]